MPRILSLAAERAKAWYKHPAKCPPLQRARRAIRSERREALQIAIETILSHLDLASLCLGSPTLDHGFIDIDMKSLVATAGIGQRRIERAIVLLKEAGFLQVEQPRMQNEQGDYYGCRAIRQITAQVRQPPAVSNRHFSGAGKPHRAFLFFLHFQGSFRAVFLPSMLPFGLLRPFSWNESLLMPLRKN